MDLDKTIYSGGFYALMRFLERKETPYNDPLAVLPPADVDLDLLNQTQLPRVEVADGFEDTQDARRKAEALAAEFSGGNALHFHLAMSIALLRRRNPPQEAQRFFLRCWREMGPVLAQDLPVRWLISSATTFADHGDTIDQRLGGQGMSILFDLIKLHDSERRLSGRENDRGFPQVKGRKRPPLAFDMQAYSLPRGDLDRILLARLWRHTEADATFRPLGQRMLNMLMSDPRSVFGRIQRYKKRAEPDA